MLTTSLSLIWGQTSELVCSLRSHIDYLCADTLAGRKAGSAEALMAAEYVAGEFASMGIEAWGAEGYMEPFSLPLKGKRYRNVAAKIEGRVPNEYIIIGAHYDHLGIKRGKIYPGADDNASGTAALIELARRMASSGYQPHYTLVFVAFDAEELGLHGSTEFASQFADNPQNVRLMVSMDMVGWLHDGAVRFQGTGTLHDSEQRLAIAAEKHGVCLTTKRFENSPLMATDTEPFARLGIPTLAVSTGISDYYHRPKDTPEKIDYEGIGKIVGLMSDFILMLDKPNGATATGKFATKHRHAQGHFDWGATVALGSSYHDYIGNALVGLPARAWNVGAWAQWSGKFLAMRTSLIYDHRQALVPSDLNDIWSQGQTLTLHSATLPVELLLKTPGKTMSAYVGVGGYASYNFGAEVDGRATSLAARSLRAMEFGWQWSIGYRFANFYIEATERTALTDVYTTTYPAAATHSSLCTVGIVF